MFMSRQKRQEALARSGTELRTQGGAHTETGTLSGENARLLRETRNPAYVDLLGKLDTGEGKLDPRFAARVAEKIRKEFPAVRCLGQFLGVLAKCYIDDTYDVHTLDYRLEILRHYHLGEALPEGIGERPELGPVRRLRLCGSLYGLLSGGVPGRPGGGNPGLNGSL